MSLPTARVTELIRDVAERVVRPRWRSLGEAEVAEKAPGDLVTVADRESEELLTAALRREAPGVLVVGEEATAADPGLLDALQRADHAFVVDPIDGTKNFVQGSPDYAVMIGEVRSGVPVRGWIWQPEHDRMYVAERGGGLLCNGERVRRRAPDPATLRGATSHRRMLIDPLPAGVTIGWTFNSCGIDYPHLATGGTDFLVYNGTKPWDHVPGVLMVREVGGAGRRLEGEEYAADGRARGLLATGSLEVWDAARSVIAR